MAKKSTKNTKRKTPKVKRPTKTSSAKASDQAEVVIPSSRKLKPKKGKFGRTKHPQKLPSVFKITKQAAMLLWQQRKLFIGLTIVYGLLNLILVQGLANNTDVGSLKNELNQAFSGHLGSLASGLSVFAVLVGSAGNGGSSPTAGAYQLFLAFIASLAIIWALRQVMAGNKVRIKDAYYQGMSPLIPFVLIILVICVQLLPLIAGAGLYSTVINNAIAITGLEKLMWLAIFIGLALLSLYLITSSIFALYIVTLSDMTPIKALRSAKQLVRHRRWTILRKLLALPVILLVVAAIIMLPIILWLTALASWIFFILTVFALVAVHAYLYTLYRELLND